MPVFNKMVYNGTEYILGGGGNIGEPLNLTVTSAGLDATITWEDNEIGTIPPTTFQKSELVRKVGSAPTSPSDGTLVVTETVKDTYKTIGYVDQGLTDGTTYYYRVFSYSDLGGISYCDAVSVTPSERWQPGVNTVAYYEFNNNLDDSSGNGFNQTLASGAVVYGTASGGGKYAYFNSSTYTVNLPLRAINYSSASYTVSFYRQPKTIFSSGAHSVFDWAIDGSSPEWIRMVDSLASRGVVNTFPAAVDTWYYITTTRNGGDVYFYVNGQLIGSGTLGGSGNYTPTFRFNAIGNATSLTNDNYLGQFIIEDKLRTAQEIQDYYNQTCEDYGLQPITPRQPGANTLAYYKFNGDLLDSSGNGNDLSGTPYGYDTGVEGQSLQNYTPGQARNITANVTPLEGAFAIAFLISLNNNQTLQRIFTFGSSGTTDVQFEFYNDFSGFQIYNNDNTTRLSFPFTQPSIGAWHSFVITGDGVNQIEVYIDGTQVSPYVNYNPTFWYPQNKDIVIGAYGNGAYDNSIDELVIEDKHWTQSDVDNYLANYN